MNQLLLATILVLMVGCTASDRPNKLPALHNYPRLGNEDCPVDHTSYDEDLIRKRAKELGVRPVDYLHMINNRKFIKK